ncbi:MAG: histidinol dehydrogenase [Thermodesulfovibrionales bacterium]|nr:histidinol dehydrogenase [Thermodesulfovibrionales bacterium]
MKIRIIKDNRQFKKFLSVLSKRAHGYSEEIFKVVKNILFETKKNKDKALRKYNRLFDNHTLPLEISEKEINEFSEKAHPEVIKALQVSAERIKRFHDKQIERSWEIRSQGEILGQIIRPLQRVGVYIPGGKASYPSTVLMNVIPAQVAGVEEIIITIPTPNGELDPSVMAAIKLLNVKKVYRVGGAQAIAAMAYGTESIKKVDKIVGPGNIYVTLAKKMVFGEVDIDMIAGPSEITIIADETANASIIAADMLSQAEHDEMASSILITDSDFVIENVLNSLKSQIKLLKRQHIAQKSLKNFGALIKTKDIYEAIEIANEIAPEHLEIITNEAEAHLKLIKNAGAIFIGQWTPEPLGDYTAGPNHTLPTCGTARFSSPLGVYDFIKRSSFLKFELDGFLNISDVVETLAKAEGLEAHANTISIRKNLLR